MEQLYRALLEKALEAEKAYYANDDPIMSDSAYDAIIRQLAYIEGVHPEWKSPSSPTHRVGGMPTNTFEKVTFPVKMLSLKNAFNEKDIQLFTDNANPYTESAYVVQPKLDGLTLVLYYENGMLVRAITRGNGSIGEDVTLNAINIDDIPKKLKGICPDTIYIRGEAVMHRQDFEELNRRVEAMGRQPYANPRNVAAGTVRQKDPAVASERVIHFYAYDIPATNSGTWNTEEEMLDRLESWGFHIPITKSTTISSLMDDIKWVKDNENRFPYAIDGAVIKTHHREACHFRLGEGSHDPNWAIAFKFTPVSAVTTLTDVTYQVGRTGHITPVAVLEPVELCGSVVSRASLHNEAYVRELNLSIGDQVVVYKAAEIIPQVDFVAVKSDNPPVLFPKSCPACGSALRKRGEYTYCPYDLCIGKREAVLRYFVSKGCMDIRGMADSMIHALVGAGKLKSPADIYKLTKADLIIPGLSADKKAESILEEIEKSKSKPFDRVLCAMGFESIASSTATLLADKYGDIDTLLSVDVPELSDMAGFGDISARAIYLALHTAGAKRLINDLRMAGLCMKQETKQLASNKLEGKSICVTGTLSEPRDAFRKLIEANGGKFVTSVSSTTDYLLAGNGGGSKRAKAEKLGVKIIDEATFKEMLK